MSFGNGGGDTAPDVVERQAHELFEQARALTGDRFAEARIDPDRGLRITIIDLDDHDASAIDSIAERLSIARWVRIERADPAALGAWEQLRRDLLSLQESDPRVLDQYPTPDPGYRRPPVEIRLAAHAESTAATLHTTYGDFVSLQVGALPYPPDQYSITNFRSMARSGTAELADPAEMTFGLDGPLTVRSGHTATHGLLLTNLAGHDVRVATNGQLTAILVDASGQPVGSYVGAQQMPLVIFTARPSQTVRIPLLVGTASVTPALGYAVPPGMWHLYALLDLADGRQVRTPALELTITAD